MASIARGAPRSSSIAWIVWATCLVLAVAYVAAFRANVPMRHDFDVVPYLVGHWPADLEWYWRFENEHRVPLQKLTIMMLSRSSDLDFRSDKLFQIASLGAASAAILLAARRLRGRSAPVDAIVPLALLSATTSAASLDAFAHVVPVALVCVSFALSIRLAKEASWVASIAFAACVLLLPLSGSSGVLFVPGLVAPSLHVAWARMRRGGSRARGELGFLLALGVASAVLVASYFRSFPTRDLPRTALDVASNVVAFSSLSVGRAEAIWTILGALVALASIVTASVLVRAAMRRDEDGPLAVLLLAQLLSCFVLASVIAWGRAAFGPTAALAHRFAPLAALLLCSLHLGAIAVRPRRLSSALQLALALLVAAAFVPDLRYGLSTGAQFREWAASVERDLRAGLPPGDVVRNNRGFRHEWNVGGTINRMYILLNSGVGGFSRDYGPSRGLAPASSAASEDVTLHDEEQTG